MQRCRPHLTKIDVVHIAYKGAAPVISDVLGGQIPFGIMNIPAVVPLVQAGRVRALAVTGEKRAGPWPNVPTMAEAGVSGYNVTAWYGLCAPSGTPPPQSAYKLEMPSSFVLLH